MLGWNDRPPITRSHLQPAAQEAGEREGREALPGLVTGARGEKDTHTTQTVSAESQAVFAYD